MIERNYADYAWEQAAALLAIDSPSGYTRKAAAWVRDRFASLGFDARITVKGGVLVDLGGADENDGVSARKAGRDADFLFGRSYVEQGDQHRAFEALRCIFCKA